MLDGYGNPVTEPFDEPIIYEVWEKKLWFNDKKIFGPFKSAEPAHSPIKHIKNMYIANVKILDGRDYNPVQNLVVVKLIED